MRTVVLGPPPPELDAIIARRRALGLDMHDEVWEGDYHMAPAAHPSHGRLGYQLAQLLGPWADRAGLLGIDPFNLGEPDDFRVPDRGFLRSEATSTFVPTAAIVVEVESPHDETWHKLDFYAARHVDEVLVAAPVSRSVSWLLLTDGRYIRSDQSGLLGPATRDLADRIDWPPSTSG